MRLEKAPGEPVTVEELKAWVTRRGLPPGYLPWMGINVEDVLRELSRPRPALVKSCQLLFFGQTSTFLDKISDTALRSAR